MKPSNHGMRVRITDPSLGLTYTGYLMPMRPDVAADLGVVGGVTGLGFISERSGVLQPVISGDRIEVLL